MVLPSPTRRSPSTLQKIVRVLADGWIAVAFLGTLSAEATSLAAHPPDSLSTHYNRLTNSYRTGSVDSVDKTALPQLITANVLQSLQGRLAGVLIRANSGDPGAGVTAQIRGAGRFGDTNPLVVVDGLVIGMTDNLSWLTPQDIERVEVLKDASAAAIYGMRAANGVILITTQRGQQGRPRVTAEVYTGVQQVTQRPQLLSTRQYIDFINESRANDGLLPAYKITTQASLDTLLRTNTDWVGALFRQAPVRNAYVSVSGGNESTRYLFSANHFRQQGALLGTDFERLSFRLNTDFQLTDNIKVGEHLTVNRTIQHGHESTDGKTLIEQALKSAPYLAITNAQFVGGYNGPNYLDAGNNALNPVGAANLVNTRWATLGLVGDVFGEWSIIDGLTYRAALGFDLRNYDRLLATPVYNMGEYAVNLTPAVDRSKQSSYNTLLEHQLAYEVKSGSHALSAVLAGSRQNYYIDNITAYTNNLPGNGITALNAGQSANDRAIGGQYNNYRIVSLLGRLAYNYGEKYWLTAGVRRDGSSRFAQGHRFGAFPSVSAGWTISREAFLERVPYLSQLHLRAGWGKTGNDNIGDFQYSSRITPNYNYPFGPTDSYLGLGAYPSTLPNASVRWETTSMSNVGLDIRALRNTVTLSVDYFSKRTTGLLVQVPLPSSVGAVAPLTNAGSVANTGLDLGLRIEGNNELLDYNVAGFASWQHNQVRSLGDRMDPIADGTVQTETVTRTAVGQPIGSFYGFQRDGIYQNGDEIRQRPGLPGTEPGDIRYADQNGDGKITDADKTYLGSPIPTFYYGLSGMIACKGVDLSLLIQGVAGNQIYNANAYWLNGYQGHYNAGTQVLGRWTPTNPSTTQPRADASNTVNFRPSDRFIENGGYLRLKTVQIGYTFPETLMANWGITKLRVYVGGQNLLTSTRYSGLDPEFASNRAVAEGIDVGVSPQPRTFLGGIQLSF